MLALVASPQSSEHVELREVPEASPGPQESVVEVRAISINRGEVTRLAAANDGDRLGWDFAGVVKTAAAGGEGPAEGTRVVGFVQGGAWAEQIAVPADRLAPLPDTVGFATASALPVAGLTALRTLRLGGLLLGKSVLVTGASGGVGCFAVQLAASAGARVTGVAGSPERAQGLMDLGANTIVTDIESVSEHFHLILESVGGSSLAQALTLVTPGGTIVTFGNSSREPTTFNVGGFYGRSGARMVGFSLLSATEAHDFSSDLAYLASRVDAGALDPRIGFEGSWRDAPQALAALRERKVQGKAVLLVE